MKVKLNNVRASYAHGLFRPQAAVGDTTPKYSCSFIFPRDHEAVKTLSAAIQSVAQATWGARAPEILKQLKASDRLPVRDGDAKGQPAYEGMFYVNASNRAAPKILDQRRNPLTEADGKPYSGCYVNAVVELRSLDGQFGKRIYARLLGVQFVRDGEPLAGGVASADDFEEIPVADEAEETGAAALF